MGLRGARRARVRPSTGHHRDRLGGAYVLLPRGRLQPHPYHDDGDNVDDEHDPDLHNNDNDHDNNDDIDVNAVYRGRRAPGPRLHTGSCLHERHRPPDLQARVRESRSARA